MDGVSYGPSGLTLRYNNANEFLLMTKHQSVDDRLAYKVKL